jgi:DeoR/GlpR family transcriptional regulator of sugar metabolism
MIKEQRFDFILNELKVHEQVMYEQLAQALDVSEDTIRRDIEHLYRNGLLSKIRGGAILLSKNPLTFHDRSAFLTEEKDIIALKAQQFVKSGSTIFMDGGTTICAIGSRFPADIQLRVVTNNQPLIDILTKFSHIEIIGLGGVYDRNTATMTGVATCKEVEKYNADVYFMGTCGVDDKLGISATWETDANVKRSMLGNAQKVVALSNHGHLKHVEAFKVCAMKDVHALLTNLDADHPDLNGFRNLRVQIV